MREFNIRPVQEYPPPNYNVKNITTRTPANLFPIICFFPALHLRSFRVFLGT
jgi:hypothetical protein